MKSISFKKLAGGSILSLALLTGGTFVYAQQSTEQSAAAEQKQEKTWKRGGGKGRHGKRGGARHGKGMMFAKLNLTDAQKEQMKQIRSKYSESFKGLRGDRKQARGERKAFDGTFNEAEVRAAAQARAAKRVDIEVARARMMSEMFAVLTPEQKTQLEQLRVERQQKHAERRAARQARKAASETTVQ